MTWEVCDKDKSYFFITSWLPQTESEIINVHRVNDERICDISLRKDFSIP